MSYSTLLFQFLKEQNLYKEVYPDILNKCPYDFEGDQELVVEWFVEKIVQGQHISQKQGGKLIKELITMQQRFFGHTSSLGKISTFWTAIHLGNDLSDPSHKEAWDYIYKRYKKGIEGYFRKLGASLQEAEEWTSDFFLRWLEGHFKKVSKGKGSFRSYLRVCLANFVREQKKQQKKFQKLKSDVRSIRAQAERHIEHSSDLMIVETALKALKDYQDQQRKHNKQNFYHIIIDMYCIKPDKISYEELGKMLGISEGAVGKQLHRAKEKLEEFIKNEIYQTAINKEEAKEQYQHIIKFIKKNQKK